MKLSSARLWATVVATGLLLSGSAAHAVDGVTEINATSIAAAGGFPFVIGTTGSYVLTSNLVAPAGTTGLMVTAADVTIDLNGFTISGSAGGVGDGIAGGPDGMTVFNGSVEGFSGAGIVGGMGTKVLRMTLMNNGVGIFAGPPPSKCLVVENVIRSNNDPAGSNIGIEEAHHCKIENNVVAENDGGGIFGGGNVIVHNQILSNGAGAGQGGILCFLGGCTIQENVIVLNSDYGISDTPGPAAGLPVPAPPGVPFPGPPVGGIGPPPNVIMKNVINDTPAGFGIYSNITNLITDNQITNSFLDGLVCGGICTVRGNLINNNNLSGASNGGATIGAGSTIHANSLSFNTGVGLVLDPGAAWSNNNAVGNTDPGADVTTLFPTPGPPHATSAFDNACTGGAAPALRCP